MSTDELVEKLASTGEVEISRIYIRHTRVVSFKVDYELYLIMSKAARKLGYKNLSDYIRTVICYDLLRQGFVSENDLYDLCFPTVPRLRESR